VKPSRHTPDPRADAALDGATPNEKENLRTIWDLTAGADERPVFASEEIDRVWDTLARAAIVAKSEDRPPRRRGMATLSVGGWPRRIVLVALTIGALGLMGSFRYQTVRVAQGERADIHLPDGSSATLNGGTTLRFARWFLGGRGVELDGEAFFDVAHDAGAPFTVFTFNATIEVLGTRFNVRSRASSMAPATVVSLESGRVRLAPRGSARTPVELAPGDVRRLATGADEIAPAASVALQESLAWLNGDLVFRDEHLGLVLEEIGHRYGVELSLASPTLAQKRVTFSFHGQREVERVVGSLTAALGLRYRATANGYQLYGAGDAI
jgi:ferric-dicitrate binding protein FerR (iron transport regulator)